jgi:hypothetical protein
MSKAHAVLLWLVLGVVFAGVGVGASWVLSRTLYDRQRAQQWVSVPAKVDAFTGRVVEYHYTFRGERYRGDRLGPIPFSVESDDSRFAAAAAVLDAAARTGKPITVWVNPDAAAESMFERDVAWRAIAMMVSFALVFSGIGITLLYVVTRIVRSPLKRFAKVQQGRSLAPLVWGFAFMWNAIIVPIAIVAIHEAITEQQFGLIASLFMVPIGIVAVVGAVVVTAKERRDPHAFISPPDAQHGAG